MATTLVELQDQVLPPLDKELTTPLAKALADHGVTLLLGDSAEAFEQSSDGLVVRLNYDVSVEQLSVEVRQAAKESTPGAFIDAFWDTLQRVSENASTSP